MSRALLIIDVQNDFCPGGALPVYYGDRIIPVINAISGDFDRVIATQDWHPHNHLSFARSQRKPAYSTAVPSNSLAISCARECVRFVTKTSEAPERRRCLAASSDIFPAPTIITVRWLSDPKILRASSTAA
jgi:nicotinamidase-related amidase